MIVSCKDKDGKIIAYTSFQIVDKWGHPCAVGQFVFIEDCWIHQDYQKKGLLRYMLEKRRYKYPIVKWIYWERRDKNKPLKTYDIDKFLRRVK